MVAGAPLKLQLRQTDCNNIYANLTAYSATTTHIARGKAEFYNCCNCKVYLKLDYCIMSRSNDIAKIIAHRK